MKVQISKRVSAISPSATLSITARAKELASSGECVISFAAGQPDYDTPKVIKSAAKKALDAGFTKYTPVSGIVELKEEIAKKLEKENKIKYNPSQIIITNGAKQALFEVLFALCSPGDEVIIATPYWVSYPEMIKASGAKIKLLKTGSDFKITPELLKKAITKNTKAFILNAPSNPTGVMYAKTELLALAKVLLKNKRIWIISDECYDAFYYGKRRQISFASLSKNAREQTITINSFSKSFSMTGWRVGYAAGSPEVISAVNALQSHLTSNACSFAQKGAAVAFAKSSKFSEKMRLEFKKRRDVLVDGLNSIQGISADSPDGAFYVFADIKKLKFPSIDFAKNLLENEKVAVIPGKPFGEEGYVRFSFATSMKDIKEGLKRIERFVENLKNSKN